MALPSGIVSSHRWGRRRSSEPEIRVGGVQRSRSYRSDPQVPSLSDPYRVARMRRQPRRCGVGGDRDLLGRELLPPNPEAARRAMRRLRLSERRRCRRVFGMRRCVNQRVRLTHVRAPRSDGVRTLERRASKRFRVAVAHPRGSIVPLRANDDETLRIALLSVPRDRGVRGGTKPSVRSAESGLRDCARMLRIGLPLLPAEL